MKNKKIKKINFLTFFLKKFSNFFSKLYFLKFLIFFIFRNVITNPKKVENFFFDKTQNNDLFISPKWKNTVLEMALKSFILSKLDHQMS